MKKFTALLLLCAWSGQVLAEVLLPKVMGSGMVLQRDVAVPIWGWAAVGEEVTVEFAGQVKTALPDSTGKWMVSLDPLEASVEPRSLVIRGANVLTLDDVLVGEVWLASGQSNMEWTFSQCDPSEWTNAQTKKDHPHVRVFHVSQHLVAGVPMDDTVGQWKSCAEITAHPQSVSAVGFFFALKIQEELGVPVGILDANWGGQRIETFIPNEGYEAAGIPLRPQRPVHARNAVGGLRGLASSVNHSADMAERGLMVAYPDFAPYGRSDNFIYNAMIAPLTPYAIRGAIWYQGESNRGAPDYFKKIQALSMGWSEVFKVPSIPIHMVQIAPFAYNKAALEQDSTLCDTIWKTQYQAAREIPGVEVVAIHDTNIDIRDIHPRFKKPVGEKLASSALRHQYGKTIPASGPRVNEARAEGNAVVVSFLDVDQGLETSDGQPPTWFELSGDGRQFVRAEASIEGQQIRVQSAQVLEPRFVRMGWVDTAIPNLRDKNGWPVFAFPSLAVKAAQMPAQP